MQDSLDEIENPPSGLKNKLHEFEVANPYAMSSLRLQSHLCEPILSIVGRINYG